MTRNQWYTSRWASATFHTLAWVVLFFLPLLFPDHREHKNPEKDHTLLDPTHIWMTILPMALFYINAYVFIPRTLNKKRTGQYLLLLLLSFIIFMLISCWVFRPDKSTWNIEINRYSLLAIIPWIFFWAMSTAFRFASDKVTTDRLLKEKENENLKTELLFLRSQVSPHFLFNVLNNMVALARLRSDRLEPSLIKLSEFMRYMLYESDEDKVLLEKEIEYVNSYIDLQKLRFGQDFPITVELDDFQYDAHLIEPMLLIPFIENAFKHGAGLLHQPELIVTLHIKDDTLNFSVKNRYNPESVEIKDKTSGIGLVNVRRRLNLLYRNRHHLDITQDNGWFIVTLQLKLQ
jgi:sensor histidine kinase YesM